MKKILDIKKDVKDIGIDGYQLSSDTQLGCVYNGPTIIDSKDTYELFMLVAVDMYKKLNSLKTDYKDFTTARTKYSTELDNKLQKLSDLILIVEETFDYENCD